MDAEFFKGKDPRLPLGDGAMYEFETFAYLEVPRTASSFICTALKTYCRERKIRKTGHFGPPRDYDSSKFYFISVRDPLDLYVSLYSHGCSGCGQLCAQMQRQGLGGLYDETWSGFEFWLRCILNPANKYLLEPQYHPVAEWIGFLSYRVLSMAIPDFVEAARTCKSEQDLRRLYEDRNVATHTVRFESLRKGLCALFNGRLRDSMRLEMALQYILDAPPLNSSERIDRYTAKQQLGAKTRKLLDEREWLLKDYFGYGFAAHAATGSGKIFPVPAIGGDFVSARAAVSGFRIIRGNSVK